MHWPYIYTNQNLTCKRGLDVSISNKCHHDIIYGNIILICVFPSHWYTFVKSWMTVRKCWKLSLIIFNWNKAFENLSIDENVVFQTKLYYTFLKAILLTNQLIVITNSFHRWLIKLKTSRKKDLKWKLFKKEIVKGKVI